MSSDDMVGISIAVDQTFDREGCRHSAMKVHHFKIATGEVLMETCNTPDCNHSRLVCLHTNNTWDRIGQYLTCNLCGLDGT